jgi:tryptophan-rich sensory protein
MTPKKLYWYHGVIFFIIVNLIAGYGITLFVDIKQVYANLKLPFFAPPVWLFGIAWTTNNILTIAGNIWAYNMKPSVSRSKYLFWQALAWLNYLVFQYLSFGTQIAWMYFIPTFSMFIFVVISMYYAYKLDTKEQNQTLWSAIKNGKSIFMSLTSLFGWLIIASALGFMIGILNK